MKLSLVASALFLLALSMSFTVHAGGGTVGSHVAPPVMNIGDFKQEQDDHTRPCAGVASVEDLGRALNDGTCAAFVKVIAPPGSLLDLGGGTLRNLIDNGVDPVNVSQKITCVGCGVKVVGQSGVYNAYMERGYNFLSVMTPDGHLYESKMFWVPVSDLARLKWDALSAPPTH